MSGDYNPYGSSYGSTMSGSASFGGKPASPAAGGGSDLIKETTTAAFPRDVLEESKKQPVLVDFWAPWCGPCRQLTPVIEKVVKEAGGRVKLVKMNIDDHPEYAGQMGIQSIPAVVAFVNGRPADGFMGAIPESQIRQFIDKIAGAAPATIRRKRLPKRWCRPANCSLPAMPAVLLLFMPPCCRPIRKTSPPLPAWRSA